MKINGNFHVGEEVDSNNTHEDPTKVKVHPGLLNNNALLNLALFLLDLNRRRLPLNESPMYGTVRCPAVTCYKMTHKDPRGTSLLVTKASLK